MIIDLQYETRKFKVDLSNPMDISLPLKAGKGNPNCYYADPVQFETIRSGDFVGSVKLGGSVNYQKITFTPHGNGTHTECYGHISPDETVTINNCLQEFHFLAQLVSVAPVEIENGDLVISLDSLKGFELIPNVKALVIRTLPNPVEKKSAQYSGTNPPYLTREVAEFLVAHGIEHLVLDLPSVDRESDGGALAAHKSFWKFPGAPRKGATITELVYVPDEIADGLYLLNLQITSFETDACPSKPVLYKVEEVS